MTESKIILTKEAFRRSVISYTIIHLIVLLLLLVAEIVWGWTQPTNTGKRYILLFVVHYISSSESSIKSRV